MFNVILITGNLVNDIAVNESNGKLYAYDKIGVYNGKDKNGNQRDSMFFDFVCFGRDAELLRDMAKKGDSVTVIGRLEEDKNEKDGRVYINKRIVCSNVTLNVRKPKRESGSAPMADPFA